MKKTLTVAAIILGIAFIASFLYFKGKRYEVVITQETIDSVLTETFPASRDYLMIFSISYSNPRVSLLEDKDRVQVGLDITLNIRLNNEPRNLGGGAT